MNQWDEVFWKRAVILMTTLILLCSTLLMYGGDGSGSENGRTGIKTNSAKEMPSRSMDEASLDLKEPIRYHACFPDGELELNYSVEELSGIDAVLESAYIEYQSLDLEVIYRTFELDQLDTNIPGASITSINLKVPFPSGICSKAGRAGDDSLYLKILFYFRDVNGNRILTKIHSTAHIMTNVAVLVHSGISEELSDELDRYYEDVEKENPVHMIEISKDWETPESVRSDLISLWEDQRIVGAVLVGDMPFAMWEMIHKDGSKEPYPMPIFYEDLDGDFLDNDSNGFYNKHFWGENDGPEIWVSFINPPDEVIPSDHLRPSSSSYSEGLYGVYYSDNYFSNSVLSRTDKEIDFNWKEQDPPSPVPDDAFSVKWTGQLKIDRYDEFNFELVRGGGVLFMLDGEELVSDYNRPPWDVTKDKVTINLTAGWHDIEVRYKENGWGDYKGQIKLSWSSETVIIDQLKDWFDKDHSYYTDELGQPKEGLLFMDYCYGLQSKMFDPIKEKHLEPLYGEHLDTGGGEPTTNASEYLEYLDKGHEITSIWSHAGGREHQFQVDPESGAKVTGAPSYKIKDTKGSVVTLIWGCHAGDFADSEYWLSASKTENLVVNYAMETDFGLAALGCTRSFGTTFDSVYHDWKEGSYLGLGYMHYKDVGYNKSFRMYQVPHLAEDMWVEDEVLWGDPFIRVHHFPEDPVVEISNGSRFISGKEVEISIWSEGATEMMVYFNGRETDWIPFSETYKLDLEYAKDVEEVVVWTRNGYGDAFQEGRDLVYFEDTPPSIDSFTINGGNSITNKSAVLLEMTFSDTLSGVSDICMSNDDLNWTDWEKAVQKRTWDLKEGDGIREVYLKVRDSAGNCVTDVRSIIVDTTAPEARVSIDGSVGMDNWYTSNVIINLGSADQDLLSIMYRIDDNDWREYQDTIIYPVNGYHVLYFYSRDLLGNIGPVMNTSFKIDTENPVVQSIEGLPEITNIKDLDLEIAAYDNVSGLGQICFSVDGYLWEEWQNFSSEINYTLPDVDGEWDIYLKVKDNAGNWIEGGGYRPIELDTMPPGLYGSDPDQGSMIEKEDTILLEFSEYFEEDSLNLSVLDYNGRDVGYAVSFLDGRTVSIDPEITGYMKFTVLIREGLMDPAGNSMRESIALNFTVEGDPPGAPEALTSELVEADILLSWRSPSNAGDLEIVGYRIYRSSVGNGWELIDITSDTHYVDSLVEENVDYSYRVAAFNEIEDGEPSEVINQLVPLSIKDQDEVDDDNEQEIKNEDRENELWIWVPIIALSLIVLIGALSVILIRSKNGQEIEE